jgi:hypothetical protein
MEYIDLTDDGLLPASTDVDRAIDQSDERGLTAIWNTYHSILFEKEVLAKADTEEKRQIFTDRLARYAAVTPSQALAANARLVKLLTGRRWSVMRDAREAGDSWTTIGTAVGVSKQGALDWYTRKIADQEQYVGKYHDTDRARAVVPE